MTPTLRLTIAIESAFGVDAKTLKSRGGPVDVAEARGAFYLLAMEVCGMSSNDVGAALGRDHTTVLTTARRARGYAETDARLARKITRAREILKGRVKA